MIHDLELTDKLSKLPQVRFDDHVFRVTGKSVDPTAASSSGGRWAPAAINDGSFSVLYTSIERDGAIAEVASYLAQLTPVPTKRLMVHELAVTTTKTLKLACANLRDLGVDMSRYGERNYIATQRIGAAINFLGLDGLIASSARWNCDNLTIFAENHSMDETLETIHSAEIDWQAWALSAGLIEN